MKWVEAVKMTESQPDTDYPVLVSERGGFYDLRIRELLLFVRGSDLREAYEELIRRKQEMIESARGYGMLDDLPPPERRGLGVPRTQSNKSWCSLATRVRRFLR
jgi:hypothetical protein